MLPAVKIIHPYVIFIGNSSKNLKANCRLSAKAMFMR
jgi:hypothetical protein